MSKIFKLDKFGYSVEIGKFAGQADGAVWFRQGNTVMLATVVSNPSKEFPGFLPLTIDYREPFSAAGKIPGGYYKREGKSSDREILISRLIDRAIRPLFPETYFNQLQVRLIEIIPRENWLYLQHLLRFLFLKSHLWVQLELLRLVE